MTVRCSPSSRACNWQPAPTYCSRAAIFSRERTRCASVTNAKPTACLLGLGLPSIDEHWVSQFAEGFYALADEHGCALVGGDTTRSEQGITLSVTVFGEVLPELAMRRSAAVCGDDIWVSGTLGAADIACRMLAGEVPADAKLLAQTRLAL